jgi:hypothetical protein
MSKKKRMPAVKKAPKKAAKKPGKKSTSKAASAPRSPRLSTEPLRVPQTSQATIFLFKTSHGNQIRTVPQLAFAGPGHVEWTVVNLIDGSDVPVTITWPDGGPWGKEPIDIKSFVRLNVDKVRPGRYKYVVSAYDAKEDPEIEFSQN